MNTNNPNDPDDLPSETSKSTPLTDAENSTPLENEKLVPNDKATGLNEQKSSDGLDKPTENSVDEIPTRLADGVISEQNNSSEMANNSATNTDSANQFNEAEDETLTPSAQKQKRSAKHFFKKNKRIIFATGITFLLTLVATLLIGVLPSKNQANSYHQQLIAEKAHNKQAIRLLELDYTKKETAKDAEVTSKKQEYDNKLAQLNDQAKEEIKKKITPDVTAQLKTELTPQVEDQLTKSLEPGIKESLTKKYTQESTAISGTYSVKESGTYLVRIEKKYYSTEYTPEQIGGNETIEIFKDLATYTKNQFDFEQSIELNLNAMEATTVLTQGQILHSYTPYTIRKVD